MKPEYIVAGKNDNGWFTYLGEGGGSVFMLTRAAVFKTIPEAETAAVLFALSRPLLIGTVKVHKIKVVKGIRISREL